MDALIAPPLRALAEKPRIGGLAVGRPPAPAHQTCADVIVHRDLVPVVTRGFDGPADLARKRLGHMFVRVDLEDPGARAGGDTGVPTPALALPRAFDDAPVEPKRDLTGAVPAIVEDDHDLVGEAEALETACQALLLVVNHDERGQPRGAHAARSHGPVPQLSGRLLRHVHGQAVHEGARVAVVEIPRGKCSRSRCSCGRRRIAIPKARSGPRGWAPKSPRVGIPVAAVRCMRPESLPT